MSRNSHDPFNTNSINNEATPPAPKMRALKVWRNGMISTLSSSVPPTVYAIRNYFQESSLGQQVGYGFILMVPALITASPWAFAQRVSRSNFFTDTLGGQISNSVLSTVLLPLFFIGALALLLRNVAGMTYDQVNGLLTPLVFFTSIAAVLVIGAGVGAGFYGWDHRREIGQSCRERKIRRAEERRALIVNAQDSDCEMGNARNAQASINADSSLRQKLTSIFCCLRSNAVEHPETSHYVVEHPETDYSNSDNTRSYQG